MIWVLLVSGVSRDLLPREARHGGRCRLTEIIRRTSAQSAARFRCFLRAFAPLREPYVDK